MPRDKEIDIKRSSNKCKYNADDKCGHNLGFNSGNTFEFDGDGCRKWRNLYGGATRQVVFEVFSVQLVVGMEVAFHVHQEYRDVYQLIPGRPWSLKLFGRFQIRCDIALRSRRWWSCRCGLAEDQARKNHWHLNQPRAAQHLIKTISFLRVWREDTDPLVLERCL